ncbi:MAG: TonB-dependent receptor, partial [Acidobacteria bacterium]|nr:TonB-dependent receptor [Acidobacteriota bacterium]
GTIKGTVTDPTGAVIPNAVVTAVHKSTAVESRRETTSSGLYVIAPLPAGAYRVSVSAAGFRTLVRDEVIVDALSTVELDLKMEIGQAAESVTVSAAAPELNTADARMGQTVRNEMYTALPLSMGNGSPRNPAAFIYLMPGVQEGGTFGFINGGQSFSKDVYLEGLPITDAVRQGESRALQFAVSVESVEQFQVETSGQSVEYNGQGSENYTIKSGTNQFHGSLYEYFRNTKLDARGFFAPARPQQNQNQYGFTFGGPIKRNKIFFFGAYDGYSYRVATAYRFVTIPTMKMRSGDFSELSVPIFDPATTSCPGGTNCTRQPFSGNLIPGNRISSASKFFQDPLPPPTHTGIANNFLNNNKGVGFNNTNVNVKVDINASDAHRFAVLFSRGAHNQSSPVRGNPVPLPLPYVVTRVVDEVPTVGQLKHTWVINSAMLNQLSYGVSRLWIPITNPTIDGNWVERAGIKGLPQGDATQSFPEVAFAGANAPQGWRGTDARPFLDALNNFTFQDNFQWIRASHSIKAGFQHQRLQDNYRARWDGTLFISNFSNAQTAGFNNGTLQNNTGNAYASYLLGTLNSATVIEDAVVTSGARYRNYAWWVGDDWKVTRNLTVNLGLRQDIMPPYVEVRDRVSWFNPDIPNPAAGGYPGALQFGGEGASPLFCNCRTRIKTHYNNWGPRIGFAYRLGDKTVIRSGYGIMYSRHGAVGGRNGAREGTGKLGFTASPGFSSTDTFSPAFDWDDGVPAYQKPPFIDSTLNAGFTTERRNGGTVRFDNPEDGARPPRYQNWNFSVQRALTSSLTLTAGYAGGNGKLLRGGGLGIWSAQIHPRYLALGNLLTSQANAATLAAAQAIFPEINLPYANFRGTFSQMLRPFPQYQNVAADFLNLGSSNYNSLQITLQKRMSSGLTFNINHTWSKTLSDARGLGAGRSAYFWETEKTHGESDRRHVFNAMVVYELPFGRGRAFNPPNLLVRGLVSGWRLSSITRIRSGLPYGVIGGSCTLPSTGGCRASYAPGYTGPVRINGDWGSGDLIGARPTFLDARAFGSPAPYTYGDTPGAGAYGLYNPAFWNEDLGVSRQFPVTDRFRLDFSAEAFNVTNSVIFNGPASLDIRNANFGRITGQQNSARSIQLALKVHF